MACWCSSSRFTKTSSLSSLASTSKCSGGDHDGGGDGGDDDDDGGGDDDDGGDAEDADAEKVDDNWFQVPGFPPDHPRNASPHSLGRSQVILMSVMTMVMMKSISEIIIISYPNLSVFYQQM